MALVNLYRGKHVNYQGSDATVVSNNFADNTITLKLADGKTITVSKNLNLFEANRYATEVIESSQKHIESLNKEIEEGEEKIKLSNKLWTNAVKSIRQYRKDIDSLFNSLNVKSANEITDSKARKEYITLSRNVSSATSAKHRASSDVIWYAHKTFDAILDRHSVELMQNVAKNYA